MVPAREEGARLEVGAAVADGHLGEALAQSLIRRRGPGARVDAQDGRARGQAGQREHQLAVEAPRAPQRAVQRVQPVRRACFGRVRRVGSTPIVQSSLTLWHFRCW